MPEQLTDKPFSTRQIKRQELPTLPVQSTLGTGWKYLFTSWMLVVLVYALAALLSILFPASRLQSAHSPMPLLEFVSPPWLGILAFYIVVALIFAIPAIYFISAIVIAIRGMWKKEGGLALLLTALVGSYVLFWTILMILFLIHSLINGP